jgi:hypothetical protein
MADKKPANEPADFDFGSREVEQPFTFKLNGETYQAARTLPAGITDAVLSIRGLPRGEQADMLRRMLDAFLLPESAKRFMERCWDPENPITDEQRRAVFAKLMELYSNRPTAPASPSSPRVDAGSAT